MDDGIAEVLLKSSAEIGSPAHLIRLGFVPEELHDIIGAPNVSDFMNPYGLLHFCLYCFSNAKATLPPKLWPITVRIDFMVTSVIHISISTPFSYI